MILPCQKKFSIINQKIWDKSKKTKNKYFLVEGLLGSMPTHLIRLGIVSNAIKDTLNINPIIILRNHTEEDNRKMFESFGISEYIYIDDIKLCFIDILYVICKIIPVIMSKDINTLLAVKYKKINIGHLVYDDIIHSNRDIYTINEINKECILTLYKAFKYILKYIKIISKFEIDMVVVTHNEYVECGTLPVAAIIKNKIILNINDIEFSVNMCKDGLYLHERFHRGLKNIISTIDKKILIKEGNMLLHERMHGESGLFDAKNAFLNKKIYTRDEMSKKYSHNNKKNVFIFMHVFSDAPHLSKMTMYRDYYEWIYDTLEKISQIDNVNWYIKAHPSAFIYKETDKIKEMMKNEKNNIFWVSDDFNTSSIKDVADAIITCQGTIGMEASCMGIPVIITGLPYYSRFGFTIEPKGRKEYYLLLNKLYKIKRLSRRKVENAKMVMGAYKRYTYTDNSILDKNVYEYAGYGKKNSYEKAYELIINNMKDKRKEDIPLYNKVRNYLKKNCNNIYNYGDL